MSLLELVIATSLMTMVLATISVVMRTGRAAWEAHEGDFTRLEAAHATVRHIVRLARQAEDVLAVSPSTDSSGSLSIRMPTGEIYFWDHDANTSTVHFGQNVANNLLADNINQLSFAAYEADGVTPASAVDDIQCLRVTVTVLLPRETNAPRSVTSWVWVRAW